MAVAVNISSDHKPLNYCSLSAEAEGGMTKMCIFQADSGGTMMIPYFLIQLVLPEITAIVLDQKCCQQDDVIVILPEVQYETLVVFKELVTEGYTSSPLGPKVLEGLLKLTPNLELEKIECCDLMDSGEDGMLAEHDDTLGDSFCNLIGQDDCNENHETVDKNQRDVATFENLIDNVSFDANILPVDRTSQACSGNFRVNEGCSKTCNNKCHSEVQAWEDKDRLRLKEKFTCNKIIETKEKLLGHLIAQDDIRQGLNTKYIVKGHQFCLDYFAIITGCSLYIVKKVLADYLNGIRLYQHGNSKLVRGMSASTVSAICWLKCFSESYGQFSPDENVTVLSYWLTKMSLFKMYQEETPSPHISESLFYDLFKTAFGPRRVDKSLPWIRISKYSTHSVCNICVALNCNQKQAKTEAELQLALDLRNNHRMNFGLARRKVDEIRQSSISFPSDNLFVQVSVVTRSDCLSNVQISV